MLISFVCLLDMQLFCVLNVNKDLKLLSCKMTDIDIFLNCDKISFHSSSNFSCSCSLSSDDKMHIKPLAISLSWRQTSLVHMPLDEFS